jgi:hypothetical protein
MVDEDRTYITTIAETRDGRALILCEVPKDDPIVTENAVRYGLRKLYGTYEMSDVQKSIERIFSMNPSETQ